MAGGLVFSIRRHPVVPKILFEDFPPLARRGQAIFAPPQPLKSNFQNTHAATNNNKQTSNKVAATVRINVSWCWRSDKVI